MRWRRSRLHARVGWNAQSAFHPYLREALQREADRILADAKRLGVEPRPPRQQTPLRVRSERADLPRELT